MEQFNPINYLIAIGEQQMTIRLLEHQLEQIRAELSEFKEKLDDLEPREPRGSDMAILQDQALNAESAEQRSDS